MTEYIEKEQAIETFKKVLPITPRSCGKTNIYMRWISALLEAWNSIPSADVQPVVRGHWIKMSDSDGYYFSCSQCGEELPRYSTAKATYDNPFPEYISLDPTNFCPNCGADMRSVNNEG